MDAIAQMNNNPRLLDGYNSGRLVKALAVSGTGGSGKAWYNNKLGEPKTYQVGGYLDRMMSPQNGHAKYILRAHRAGMDKQEIGFIHSYFEEIQALTKQWAPKFLDRATAEALERDPEVVERAGVATQLFSHASSTMHAHRDKPLVLSLIHI